MKSRVMLAVAITALVVAVVTYALARGTAARAEAGPPKAEAAEERPPQVPGLKLARAVAGEGWEVVTATGSVAPDLGRSVKLGPRVAGKVAAVYVQVGDRVRAGQVLATVTSTELAQARATYRQAAAKLQAARTNSQRQHKLASLGAFGKRPAEEAETASLTAQGDLTEAKAGLAKAQSELALSTKKSARMRGLYTGGMVARQDVETAEADYQCDVVDLEAARAKLKQAEARVGIAKSYRAREEKVLGGNLLTAKEVQAAQAEVTAAELEVSGAAEALRVLGSSLSSAGDTLAVTSPIAGRVVAQSVTLGEMVEPASMLFTVMDLGEVQVTADIYEKDLAKVHAGQSVEVRVESFPGRVFTGTLRAVSDALDPQSRTAKLRCVVRNSDGALKPEMFATVSVVTAKHANAVLVPKQAVLDDGAKKVVFTPCLDCKEDKAAGKSVCGKFDKVEVKPGPAHGDQMEITGEIEPGQEVVTEGGYQLKTALGSATLDAGCADD